LNRRSSNPEKKIEIKIGDDAADAWKRASKQGMARRSWKGRRMPDPACQFISYTPYKQ
jgi:hypothetical protein